MPRRARPSRSLGLTLVELLAACVVLALAATLTLGAASGLRGPHERVAAGAAIKDALRRARVAARGDVWDGRAVEARFGERIEIAPGPDDEEFDNANVQQNEGRLDAIRIALPTGWTASIVWISESRIRTPRASGIDPSMTLVFDASGRCADAGVLARSNRGDLALVDLLGLSGQTTLFVGDGAAETLRMKGITP
jgi:hypothetical protein